MKERRYFVGILFPQYFQSTKYFEIIQNYDWNWNLFLLEFSISSEKKIFLSGFKNILDKIHN